MLVDACGRANGVSECMAENLIQLSHSSKSQRNIFLPSLRDLPPCLDYLFLAGVNQIGTGASGTDYRLRGHLQHRDKNVSTREQQPIGGFLKYVRQSMAANIPSESADSRLASSCIGNIQIPYY